MSASVISTGLTAIIVFVAVSLLVLSARRTGHTPWNTSLPVLGGHEPPTHAWSRFHIRFYPMTLLLLAFEMEMMFMYPWAVVYAAEGLKALAEMGMFLALLTLGILYAYKEGALRWQ